MLALEDGYFNLRTPSSCCSANQSLNNHQPSPEDWVRRASDLSIATPLSVGPIPSPSGDNDQAGQDESMVSGFWFYVASIAHSVLQSLSTSQPFDLDEHAKTYSAVLVSSSPQLQAHSPAQQPTAPQPYNLSQQPAAFLSSSSVITEPADARPSTPNIHSVYHHQPPSIYVQPNVVPDVSSNQQALRSGAPQSHEPLQTISSSGTLIPSQHLTNQYPGQVSSSGRKQRFTMGPRADCLKCREGIKGHWMHFD